MKCRSGRDQNAFEETQSISEIIQEDTDPTEGLVMAGRVLYMLENLRLSDSARDSQLVADGFVRVLEPLNKGKGLKKKFLWFKRSLIDKSDSAAGRDCIIDMAITKGHSRRKNDPIWSPPYQGFKRLQVKLKDSYFGEDVFVWYLKRDKTYLKDALESNWQQSFLKLNGATTVLETLENHMRDQVRSHAREIARQKETTLHQALEVLVTKHLFKGLPKSRSYVSRREFVRTMTNLNVTISVKDMASIFNKLDLSGTGWVNKSDIVDFILFSDDEIKALASRLRQKLLTYSKEKELESTFTSLFQQMDKDGDLKLSSREFQDFLNKLNIKLAPDEVVRLVDQLDLNGNGQIDYFEFVSFINQSGNAKDKMVNKRIRQAARKLHKHMLTSATLGHPSGRLGTGPDWDRAWGMLQGEIKHRYRGKGYFTSEGLRLWLNKNGCAINPLETLELLNSIGCETQILDRERLVSFVSKFDPKENSFSRMKKRYNQNVAPPRDEWKSDVDTALAALRQSLTSLRKHGSLLSYFGLPKDSRLPCKKLARRMSRRATLKYLTTAEYMQVATALDIDGDGFLCEDDLRQFIRGGSGSKTASTCEKLELEKLGLLEQDRRCTSDLDAGYDVECKDGNSTDQGESWKSEIDEKEQSDHDASIDLGVTNPTVDEQPTVKSAFLRNKWIEHIDRCRKMSRGVYLSTELDVDSIRAAVAEALSVREHPISLRKEFSKYDVHGDGVVSLKHFRRVLAKVGLAVPEAQKRPLAKLVLDRHNGSCNYERFCALVDTVKPNDISGTHERIWKMFKDKDYEFALEAFDRVGEGFVTENNFDDALRLLNIKLHRFDRAALFSIIQDPVDPKRLNYLKLDELISLYQQSGSSRDQGIEFDEGKLFQLCKSAMFNTEARMRAVDFHSYFEVYDEAGTGVIGFEHFVNAVKKLFSDCSHGRTLHSTDLGLVCEFCSPPQQQVRPPAATIDYSMLCEYLEGVREIVLHGVDQVALLAEFKEALRRLSTQNHIAVSTLLDDFRQLNGKTSRTSFRAFLKKLGLTMDDRSVLKLMTLANTENDGNVDVDYLIALASTENRKRWQSLEEKLRSSIVRAANLDPCFDVRLVFNHDKGAVKFPDFADGLRKLGLFLLQEECIGFYEHLSKRDGSGNKLRCLHLKDLLAAVDHTEEELDSIATRLARRLIELEHDGIRVCQELSDIAATETNSSLRTVAWADFAKVATQLGLPLSRSDIDILARRFSCPKNKLRCRYVDLIDLCVCRARSVALREVR